MSIITQNTESPGGLPDCQTGRAGRYAPGDIGSLAYHGARRGLSHGTPICPCGCGSLPLAIYTTSALMPVMFSLIQRSTESLMMALCTVRYRGILCVGGGFWESVCGPENVPSIICSVINDRRKEQSAVLAEPSGSHGTAHRAHFHMSCDTA